MTSEIGGVRLVLIKVPRPGLLYARSYYRIRSHAINSHPESSLSLFLVFSLSLSLSLSRPPHQAGIFACACLSSVKNSFNRWAAPLNRILNYYRWIRILFLLFNKKNIQRLKGKLQWLDDSEYSKFAQIEIKFRYNV